MNSSTASLYQLGSCSGVPFDIACGQPAKPGDNIVVYFTGGGLATRNGDRSGGFVQTGTVAPPDGSILFRTAQTPTRYNRRIPAPVQFSGIAPGTASEYQLNTVVPVGVSPGDSVPLTVSFWKQLGYCDDCCWTMISAVRAANKACAGSCSHRRERFVSLHYGSTFVRERFGNSRNSRLHRLRPDVVIEQGRRTIAVGDEVHAVAGPHGVEVS